MENKFYDIFHLCGNNESIIVFVDDDTDMIVTWDKKNKFTLLCRERADFMELAQKEIDVGNSIEDLLLHAESFFSEYMDAQIDKMLADCKESGLHGKKIVNEDRCSNCGFCILD